MQPTNYSPLGFEAQTKKRIGDYETQTKNPEATGFEAKPGETVATGFEAKPGETIATNFEAKLGETVPEVLRPNR
jgi:hypothetical protein